VNGWQLTKTGGSYRLRRSLECVRFDEDSSHGRLLLTNALLDPVNRQFKLLHIEPPAELFSDGTAWTDNAESGVASLPLRSSPRESGSNRAV
jgi:hypothetical protein